MVAVPSNGNNASTTPVIATTWGKYPSVVRTSPVPITVPAQVGLHANVRNGYDRGHDRNYNDDEGSNRERGQDLARGSEGTASYNSPSAQGTEPPRSLHIVRASERRNAEQAANGLSSLTTNVMSPNSNGTQRVGQPGKSIITAKGKTIITTSKGNLTPAPLSATTAVSTGSVPSGRIITTQRDAATGAAPMSLTFSGANHGITLTSAVLSQYNAYVPIAYLGDPMSNNNVSVVNTPFGPIHLPLQLPLQYHAPVVPDDHAVTPPLAPAIAEVMHRELAALRNDQPVSILYDESDAHRPKTNHNTSTTKPMSSPSADLAPLKKVNEMVDVSPQNVISVCKLQLHSA